MLNLISILSTFIFAQVIMISFLDLIFGRIYILKYNITKGIMLKHIIFFILNTIILLTFTKFYQPY